MRVSILDYLTTPIEYSVAYRMMHFKHENIIKNQENSCIFFIRHNPVFTAGKMTKVEDPKDYRYEFINTDRGGKITYHDSGQLVCYPILKLSDFGIQNGNYVSFLYEWISSSLEELGFAIHNSLDIGSVWIYNSSGEALKVSSIGVYIHKGVTKHGFAVNFNTNLDVFQTFRVCSMGHTKLIGNIYISYQNLFVALLNNLKLDYNIVHGENPNRTTQSV